jgi:hypothetical protein
LKNIDFLIKLNPDYAQFAILCLYPNTEVFNNAIEKGLIKKGKWEEYCLKPNRNFIIDHWEEFLKTDELVELQKIAYKKYYLRLSYMIKSILSIRSYYEFKTKFNAMIKLFS